MIAAAMKPTPSERFVETWLTAWIAWPPSSTWRLLVRALSAMSITFSTSAFGFCWPMPFQLTFAYAVWPSGLICGRPAGRVYGLPTLATDGTLATFGEHRRRSAAARPGR